MNQIKFKSFKIKTHFGRFQRMPYEYTTGKKSKQRSLKQRIKGLFFTVLHLLSTLFKGFGAYRIAAAILKWLVALDDDNAMYKLGVMHWWGYKFIRDPVKAIELIEYAAIRGNIQAQKFKQRMTDDGLWRQGKNRDEFMEMYDDHIYKDDKRNRSLHIIPIFIYTILIFLIAYLLR